MNGVEQLWASMGRDIFDYQQLSDVLKDYSKPRDKITALMASGLVVRVKKGLYVFGDAWRRKPVSRELLANLVYGPSYVSLEYALSHYGLIPEGVTMVTSVTCGKSRRFQTPFGEFLYRPVPMKAYAAGIMREQAGDDYFLIASPEKALVDFVWRDRRFRPSVPSDYGAYLREDLRIDPERLAHFDMGVLRTVAAGYDSPRLGMLVSHLHETHKEGT